MSSYEKTLIGSSIPLDEMDPEDSNLNNLIPEAEIEADIITVVDSFGTEEFQSIYLNVYDNIQSFSIENKRKLCEKLVNKISEIYNFEFVPILNFENTIEINDFLKLVEFLEYDYINFLASVIIGMDMTILKKDLNKFLTLNWEEIFKKIEVLSTNNTIIFGLISEFFRTNNKDEIFKFIRSRLEKDKMLIILQVMEGELIK